MTTIQQLKKQKYGKHFELASRIIKSNKKSKIIDIGASKKSIKLFLDKETFHTLDFEGDHTYLQDLNANQQLPIKDNSYDVVVCLETLEHLCYPKRILKEIKRILKPDGIFIMSLPNEYNLYRRLLYLFGITTKVNEPFVVLENHLHIHFPRVKDIIKFYESEFKIDEIHYLWHGRHLKQIDALFDFLSKTFPSLFCRLVLISGRKEGIEI